MKLFGTAPVTTGAETCEELNEDANTDQKDKTC
jgi:hypothetical protein